MSDFDQMLGMFVLGALTMFASYTVLTFLFWPKRSKDVKAAPDGLVYVAVDSRVAAAQASALKDLRGDDPRWLAIVLLATRLQNVALKAAMQAEKQEEKAQRLAEAKGVGLLLRTLEEARSAGTKEG